jgi:hypothetical protein
MKRITAFFFIVFLIPVWSVMARGGEQGSDGGRSQGQSQPANYGSQGSPQERQASSGNKSQPVVINVNRPSSGGHGKNYPSQQSASQQTSGAPSYGKLQWTQKGQVKQAGQKKSSANYNPSALRTGGTMTKQSVSMSVNNTQMKTASVIHHHPYEQNYVRKKLQKLGVKSAPGYITNRQEVVHTDRQHSMIAYPKTGFNSQAINATAFSARHFNDTVVRSQMSLVSSASWQDRVHGFNRNETSMNHYYWHNDRNFNYCHYIDNWGYHWYGWYVGSNYFWTRNFNNRWWWYDADFDRWCFWNDGFWWWQDPYHIGDLYCYNNTTYVPVNSAEDNVAVAVPDSTNLRSFNSPDNTRTVKVVADTQDAFLYDASNPPQFSPVYLASGVQDVMFSDPKSGKPLEIILKLNDGSFDMFDGNGQPYNSGAAPAEEQSSPDGAPSTLPQ